MVAPGSLDLLRSPVLPIPIPDLWRWSGAATPALPALGGLEGGDEDQQQAAERQRQQEAELADAHRRHVHPGRADQDPAGQPPGLASPDTPLLGPILMTSLEEVKTNRVYR